MKKIGLPRRPRHSVRLRLTVLYGSLFLISGAGLLGITYVLVRNASRKGYTYTSPDGLTTTIIGDKRAAADFFVSGTGIDHAQADQMAVQAGQQRDQQLHELLVQSGIALGIMVIVSMVLGWLVAGRILGRLSTITATARAISATNLHERLAVEGPRDELRELGDTIDDLLARLESSFQAHRRFIANASHELRTPLARQRVIVQVALSDPDATSESLRAAHERVLASGEQQDRLITALLTLARGQAGLDVRRPFDLDEVARQVITPRRAEAAAREVVIRDRLQAAPVAGKSQLAEQLVVNLVSNAVLYNVPGGWVDVVTETRGDRAVLSVINTGPVVARDDMTRLFQPFQRLESADRTGPGEGLGLGLSIVHAIAEAHGAVIDAAPRPAGGLAVSVTFPPVGHEMPNSADSTRPTSAADPGLTMSR